MADFGRQLFQAVLSGPVHESFRRSQDRARAAGKGLRLRLRIEAPDLAVLPWEYLYDPSAGDYVCLSSDTPVVRYLEFDHPPEALLVRPPLAVLGVIASPNDRPTLDVARERQRVEAATRGLRDGGSLAITWLEGSTWRDLQRAMRRGPYHVLHFVGHGGFDAAAGEGVVALTDDDGRTALLSATQLGRILADHESLRLVVLNACLGARGSGADVFSSTAATLVRRGVPAVVAMQYEISDRAAVEFARSLYEAIADGWPVDAAVSEARKAISFAAARTVEWGTPVLHMRSPDGVLFRLDTTATRAVPQRARDAAVQHGALEPDTSAPGAKSSGATVPEPVPPTQPPGPSVAEQVSALRARLLLATGESDLRALRYEVEALGAAYPTDVGVRMLHDQVVGAMQPRAPMASPAPGRGRGLGRWGAGAGFAATALLAFVVVRRGTETGELGVNTSATLDTAAVVSEPIPHATPPDATPPNTTPPKSTSPRPTPSNSGRPNPPPADPTPIRPPTTVPVVVAPVRPTLPATGTGGVSAGASGAGTAAGRPAPDPTGWPFAAVLTRRSAPFLLGRGYVRALSLEPEGSTGWLVTLGVTAAPSAGRAGRVGARVTCTFRGGTPDAVDVPVPVQFGPSGGTAEFQGRFRVASRWPSGDYPVACVSQGGEAVFTGRVPVRWKVGRAPLTRVVRPLGVTREPVTVHQPVGPE